MLSGLFRSKSIVSPLIIFLILFFRSAVMTQPEDGPVISRIMTLGVFHFSYPNLDAVATHKNNQIDVLEQPWQSEIENLVTALAGFRPTIVAVEVHPDKQPRMDSLYALYINSQTALTRNEVQQIGFRLGRILNLNKVWCIDDMGRHYNNILTLFDDSTRLENFGHHYHNSSDTMYYKARPAEKITSILETLIIDNDPDAVSESLGAYFVNLFKYEEEPGDFTGVDFETGRWFNRNLRILRNIQRIPRGPDDRILLIIGSGHLNLMNHFLEVSPEFELISPLPFLDEAKRMNYE
ncbi:MAG: DUF5694 domain-containing protein [Bacteroidales bacterium]